VPFEPRKLECISTMTNTKAEVMFHMLPCTMQNIAGPLILRIFGADSLIRNRQDRELSALLVDLKKVLVRFREVFSNVHELVDMRVFYDIYRPLMSGFYPDGVVLEGSADLFTDLSAEHDSYHGRLLRDGLVSLREGKAVAMGPGPSAGQSSMILMFDLLLGVSECHVEDAAAFQAEMLCYMPRCVSVSLS
jgi:hypothetical protein